jgi:hypothetical protein
MTRGVEYARVQIPAPAPSPSGEDWGSSAWSEQLGPVHGGQGDGFPTPVANRGAPYGVWFEPSALRREDQRSGAHPASKAGASKRVGVRLLGLPQSLILASGWG